MPSNLLQHPSGSKGQLEDGTGVEDHLLHLFPVHARHEHVSLILWFGLASRLCAGSTDGLQNLWVKRVAEAGVTNYSCSAEMFAWNLMPALSLNARAEYASRGSSTGLPISQGMLANILYHVSTDEDY